jgi:hypothetical protein
VGTEVSTHDRWQLTGECRSTCDLFQREKENFQNPTEKIVGKHSTVKKKIHVKSKQSLKT